jgi:NTP pyrophosphatase (non-canonical NTP hydrolase)
MVRSEVAWFAEIMEQKLSENDHKAHWSGFGYGWLLHRLRQETGELERAINLGKCDAEQIAREAADVANFSMMIADNARRAAQAAGKGA